MSILSFLFEMVAMCHVVFLRSRFLKCRYGAENQLSCKILWQLVKPLQRYGIFSICQNGSCLPGWILEIQNFIGQ